MKKDQRNQRKKIQEIESKEGSGTELISLFVPPEKNLSRVKEQIQNEKTQADNIKSQTTRENVKSGLS